MSSRQLCVREIRGEERDRATLMHRQGQKQPSDFNTNIEIPMLVQVATRRTLR